MAWVDEVASYHEADQLKAFLDMISHAEGTDRYGVNDGYDVLVGGELFYDYRDHPNIRVQLSPTLASTAAGRYQILYRWWKPYKQQLKLPDFGPDSQDRYAIQQIREQGAYSDVVEGRIEEAIAKCANIWASLPGAGYGQREVELGSLVGHFESNGGVTA
ncbi:muramidase (phage lysozyme) [Modicisalibacter xianhensis]|uniref:Muramidase (Phage lysozyme) n=1 Tax=Modicisalibacter xianhensis TaxID=442341 RepID=A0A4R8F8T3_9GAMM|nr:glycoside hydrolase family 104 protein [Halomonas xianhensis]TDX21896.1 muramidase (phage lysozyme) [Halomonas xianhensis]